MKSISVVVITLLVAMATTLLLDLPFVEAKIERRVLVGLLILIELFTGLLFFKEVIKSIQKK